MSAVVTDTHALIWYLQDDPRLSQSAADAMDLASASGNKIYMPTICFVEATYLLEKSRIPPNTLSVIEATLLATPSTIEAVKLDFDIAKVLAQIPRSRVPDLPDRIIAATALALGLPLVTADRQIRASGIETIW